MRKRYFLSAVLILALFSVPVLSACNSPAAITLPPVTIHVAAASSLNKVLDELNALYVKQNPNVTIVPDYSTSGDLQTKIESGAAADIFFPDSETRMDNLQNRGLILDNTRKDLLNNQMVLIVPPSNPLGLVDFTDIAFYYVSAVAISNPDLESSGAYALQDFDELGLSFPVGAKEVKLATDADVITAVANNSVDAGIVYATDVLNSGGILGIAVGPANINAKIIYPVAVVKSSQIQDEAIKYANFLSSAQAKAIFEKNGFTFKG